MAAEYPQHILTILKELVTPKTCLGTKEKQPSKNHAVLNRSLADCLDRCLGATLKSHCQINGQDIAGFVYDCLQGILDDQSDVTDKIRINKHSTLIVLTKHKSESDLRWTYVSWTIAIVRLLNKAIDEAMCVYDKEHVSEKSTCGRSTKHTVQPTPSPDTFSMAEQKLIISAVQFTVGFGIIPYLHAGVGVPIEKRSHFGMLLQGNEVLSNVKEKEWRLFYCLKSLMELVEQPSLGALVLSRSLGDIVAGLLQLCCASSVKERKKILVQEIPHNQHEKDSSYKEFSINDLEQCENILKKLLGKVYPPVLVRELLVLQGGTARKITEDGKPVLQRSPAWLRKACGKLLSDILIKPKGIQFLLKGMINSVEGEKDIDWKKCEAVGKVIAHCPRQSLSTVEYYKNICPQILELLYLKDKKLNRQYLKVTVSTLSVMMTQQPQLTEKYAVQPLLQPLLCCVKIAQEFKDNDIVVEEGLINRCIQDVHKVFVVAMEPHNIMLKYLRDILHVIFTMFCAVQAGVSHLKAILQEILVTGLKQCDSCLEILKVFAFEENKETIPLMSSTIQFEGGDHGGIKAVWLSSKVSDWESRLSVVLELLQTLDQDQVSADLFIYLLKELSTVLCEEINPSLMKNEPVSFLETDYPVEKLNRNLMLLSLLASMCEKLGHTCFKSTPHILQFVKVTLERCVMVLQHTADEELSIFESETVTMAMGLLTAVMSGASEVSPSDREKTKELLPLLECLSEQHPDSSVKEMATDLRIAIATHGFVLSESLKKNMGPLSKSSDESDEIHSNLQDIRTVENETMDDINQKSVISATQKPLIEVISETDFENLNVSVEKEDSNIASLPMDNVKISDNKHDQHNYSDSTLSNNNAVSNVASSISIDNVTISDQEYRENYKPSKTAPKHTSGLKQAFDELLDPLIPVRGHALISLRRLIEQKDPETLEKEDVLLKIFHENLDHGDTYIYLSAIQGLAALGDRKPAMVVRILAREYANFNREEGSEKKIKTRSAEFRMKIGEVLMKIIKELGEITPYYRDVLLSSTLTGATDKDHLVRASAVSNLGELCKMLKYSVGNIIYSVLECVSALVKTDPEVEVRRAAAMFITLLLQGLGENAVKILDSALRDLYHLLKYVHAVEKDDVVQLHVQMALEELDKIMRKYLFPAQTFTKKICVLDPP